MPRRPRRAPASSPPPRRRAIARLHLRVVTSLLKPRRALAARAFSTANRAPIAAYAEWSPTRAATTVNATANALVAAHSNHASASAYSRETYASSSRRESPPPRSASRSLDASATARASASATAARRRRSRGSRTGAERPRPIRTRILTQILTRSRPRRLATGSDGRPWRLRVSPRRFRRQSWLVSLEEIRRVRGVARRDKRALRRRRRVPATALQRLSIGVSFGREQSPVFIRGDDERRRRRRRPRRATRRRPRGVAFHGQRLRVRLGAPSRRAPL